MSIEVEGSVALVIGASDEMGTALSFELARRGARLALVARRVGPLSALAEAVAVRGATTIAIPADIADREDRLEMVDLATRRLGPIDILVNSGGIGRATGFADVSAAAVIDANLVAPMALTREVIAGMLERGRGHILTVATMAAVGLPYLVAYSASQAGLVAFSTALGEELRGTGVSATVVSPGLSGDDAQVPSHLAADDVPAMARKAVTAMCRNRPQVLLTRKPVRPLLLLKAVSEQAFRSVTRSLVVSQYFQVRADDEGR